MRFVFFLLTAFLTVVSVRQVQAADTIKTGVAVKDENKNKDKGIDKEKDEGLIIEDEPVTTPAKSEEKVSTSKSPKDSLKADTTRSTQKTSNKDEPVTTSAKSEEKVSSSKPSKDSLKADTTRQIQKNSNKVAKVNQEDEDLILEGGEEDILSGQQVKPVKTATKTTGSDSGKVVKKSSTDSTSVTKAPDSSKSAVPQISNEKPVQAAPVLPTPQQIGQKETVKIEKTQSINFARNLNEYRSPKVAMMLSLLVPGAGQEYAKSHLQAGLFGAIEVAIISVGAVLGVKGNNELKNAHEFADKNYSADKFKDYYGKLQSHLDKDTTGILEGIFYGQEPDTFFNDAKNKTGNFYSTIREGSNPFVNGWVDAKPGFDLGFKIADSGYVNYKSSDKSSADSSYLVYKKGDSTNVKYGFSSYQKKYNDMVGKSSAYYRASRMVFISLLINHILSAVDAGITAKAYNDRLLGKQTVWQRLNLKEADVCIGDHSLTGYALQVRF